MSEVLQVFFLVCSTKSPLGLPPTNMVFGKRDLCRSMFVGERVARRGTTYLLLVSREDHAIFFWKRTWREGAQTCFRRSEKDRGTLGEESHLSAVSLQTFSDARTQRASCLHTADKLVGCGACRGVVDQNELKQGHGAVSDRGAPPHHHCIGQSQTFGNCQCAFKSGKSRHCLACRVLQHVYLIFCLSQ